MSWLRRVTVCMAAVAGLSGLWLSAAHANCDAVYGPALIAHLRDLSGSTSYSNFKTSLVTSLQHSSNGSFAAGGNIQNLLGLSLTGQQASAMEQIATNNANYTKNTSDHLQIYEDFGSPEMAEDYNECVKLESRGLITGGSIDIPQGHLVFTITTNSAHASVVSVRYDHGAAICSGTMLPKGGAPVVVAGILGLACDRRAPQSKKTIIVDIMTDSGVFTVFMPPAEAQTVTCASNLLLTAIAEINSAEYNILKAPSDPIGLFYSKMAAASLKKAQDHLHTAGYVGDGYADNLFAKEIGEVSGITTAQSVLNPTNYVLLVEMSSRVDELKLFISSKLTDRCPAKPIKKSQGMGIR